MGGFWGKHFACELARHLWLSEKVYDVCDAGQAIKSSLGNSLVAVNKFVNCLSARDNLANPVSREHFVVLNCQQFICIALAGKHAGRNQN